MAGATALTSASGMPSLSRCRPRPSRSTSIHTSPRSLRSRSRSQRRPAERERAELASGGLGRPPRERPQAATFWDLLSPIPSNGSWDRRSDPTDCRASARVGGTARPSPARQPVDSATREGGLARIVHRRVIRRVDGSVGAPVEEVDDVPPPMEARLEAAVGRVTERLSWVGWLSLIATVAYVLANAMPMFHLGPIVAAIDRNSGDLIRLAAGAATLVLPAALELGGSGARTAVPWLMRGAILSALVMVANVVDDGVRDWVIRNLVDLNADPPIGLNDLTQPVSLALTA